MRLLLSLLATLLVMLISPTESMAQPVQNGTRLSHLLPEKILPLVGEQCGCIAFRTGSALVNENVLFFATPTFGHVRVANRDYQLAHRSRRLLGKQYVNTFVAAGMSITLETTETSFEKVCSSYSDPPPHGSCFVGTMRVRVENKSTSTPVVQICGC